MEKHFLNLSEHQFNLSLSEILLLKQFSIKFSCEVCSSIGGCESIRDLQQSKLLDINCFEFKFVESIFAVRKIFSSINTVFNNDEELIKNIKIFISICSMDGLLINQNNYFEEIINNNKFGLVTLVFDRRSLCKTIFNIKNNNFEVTNYSKAINEKISNFIRENNTKNFKVALSGGIDIKDIESNQDIYNQFDYIKTGLFTLDVKEEKDIINTIRVKQLQEKEILKTMKDILLYKNQYISSRYIHLENYIKKN